MRIQKLSSLSFRAKMVNYLKAIHASSIGSQQDEEKSAAQFQKLNAVLPSYFLTTGYYNNKDMLKLEKYDDKTKANHTIQMCSVSGNNTMHIGDVEVENLSKLVDTLESIYGNTDEIEDKAFKVSDDMLLNNPKAKEIMSIVKKEVMPKIECRFSLDKPYSIEITSANDEGKDLYISYRSDKKEGFFEPFIAKENLKIIFRTYDKAYNPIQHCGYFYLPEDLSEKDSTEFWVKNFEKTISQIINNRYVDLLIN